jgi:hypothetical protein
LPIEIFGWKLWQNEVLETLVNHQKMSLELQRVVGEWLEESGLCGICILEDRGKGYEDLEGGLGDGMDLNPEVPVLRGTETEIETETWTKREREMRKGICLNHEAVLLLRATETETRRETWS